MRTRAQSAAICPVRPRPRPGPGRCRRHTKKEEFDKHFHKFPRLISFNKLICLASYGVGGVMLVGGGRYVGGSAAKKEPSKK